MLYRSIPAGTVSDSPYSDRIKLMVLESGPSGNGGENWVREHRNPYQDHLNLFGRPAKHPIGMIALMSDSDTTGTSASADFGEIQLKRRSL